MAAARISYKVDQNIKPESNDLLRIIHNGIDDIILNLKRAVDLKGVGPEETIGRTNDAVKKILKVFSDFQDGLAPEIGQMKENEINPVNKGVIQTENVLTPNNFGSSKAHIVSDAKLLKQNLLIESRKDIGAKEADILDLRTGINYDSYNINGFHNVNITNGYQTPLTERLTNCTELEKLYLKKHEEIIRIFGFVVNLFDKYKYAIKVILFLLKNLVRAEQRNVPPPPPPPPGSVSVRLPKPLITNINLLLKDQANIQTIIDGMEKVVGETDTAIHKTDEPKIKESLEAQGSPPNIAPPPPPGPPPPPPGPPP